MNQRGISRKEMARLLQSAAYRVKKEPKPEQRSMLPPYSDEKLASARQIFSKAGWRVLFQKRPCAGGIAQYMTIETSASGRDVYRTTVTMVRGVFPYAWHTSGGCGTHRFRLNPDGDLMDYIDRDN